MEIVGLVMAFICRLAYAMEDLPPRFHQTINDSVAQSIDDALENHIPAALQLTIHTAVTNALNAALPPLLAPLATHAALTRMETKMGRMETKMERMETKLTRVEIMQAKVRPMCIGGYRIINPRCLIRPKAVGQMFNTW